MPFDWMEVKRNADHTKGLHKKRIAMYRSELEERAALLHRLGYTREKTRSRLTAQIGWDFEHQKSPVPASDVEAIVDRVYGGGAPGAPGATAGVRANGDAVRAAPAKGGQKT
jgi:hypothetical protein